MHSVVRRTIAGVKKRIVLGNHRLSVNRQDTWIRGNLRMTYKVVLTKPFSSDLKKIEMKGHKKVAQAVRAAMTEAGTIGGIKSLSRTKHGESRIPNVEKYDLHDGFRLVVQLVDGPQKVRAFLFVGTHDDTQRWLDVHRNYRWVKNERDGVLEFVMVTVGAAERHVPSDRLNLEALEQDREKPILHRLSDADWQRLNVSAEVLQVLNRVTPETFEQDADGIFDNLTERCGWDVASLLFDLMWHAQANEWTQLRQRLALVNGNALVVDADAAAVAMLASENSESFITFDDRGLWDELFTRGTLADWMLYLHPEQRSVAERELRGPGRLRGVSGSGKTCVLVHRARFLAKRDKQPILLVTLTESMRKLLERMVQDLCGVEESLITIKTMSNLARETLAGTEYASLVQRSASDRIEDAYKVAESTVRKHVDYGRSVFSSMTYVQLINFLKSEIPYVRGRLTEERLEEYLDAKVFLRHGRGTPLSQMERRIALDAIKAYMNSLATVGVRDHEGVVSLALGAVQREGYTHGRFRGVLSDEVQDLSELDLSLLAKLKTPDGNLIAKVADGLFLVGDGAQSIYKRGFALSRIGIDISGRSFILKKNYRNTNEILKAAFGLVSQYEFSDVDEENLAKPSMPDFAESHGERPLLLRCGTTEEEVAYVAAAIQSSLAMGQAPGQICVIAPTVGIRQDMENALHATGIASAELRNDVDYESDNVKISTIESAKGHEFSAVYIMGLVEGALPAQSIEATELPREASRLYVAMTRAREKLVMSYSPRPSAPASRFLAAIQDNCDEAQLRHGELRYIS